MDKRILLYPDINQTIFIEFKMSKKWVSQQTAILAIIPRDENPEKILKIFPNFIAVNMLENRYKRSDLLDAILGANDQKEVVFIRRKGKKFEQITMKPSTEMHGGMKLSEILESIIRENYNDPRYYLYLMIPMYSGIGTLKDGIFKFLSPCGGKVISINDHNVSITDTCLFCKHFADLITEGTCSRRFSFVPPKENIEQIASATESSEEVANKILDRLSKMEGAKNIILTIEKLKGAKRK